MAHPLDGAVAKLNRAREQINGLDQAIRMAIEGHAYRVVIAEREPHSSYRALRLEPGQVGIPPLDWSAIIGEIAHDLRSALDLLACELALKKNASVDTRDISFPIRLYGRQAKPGGRWKQRWHSRLVTPFKRKHGARIKRLQPYHRGNGQRRSLLWLLHELNNADKHRAIQMVAVSAGRIMPQVVKMTRDPDNVHDTPLLRGFEVKQGVPLKDSAKVGHIDATVSPKSKVEMDIRITAKVVFDQGCDAIRGLEVIRLLVGAEQAVLEALKLFAGDLRAE